MASSSAQLTLQVVCEHGDGLALGDPRPVAEEHDVLTAQSAVSARAALRPQQQPQAEAQGEPVSERELGAVGGNGDLEDLILGTRRVDGLVKQGFSTHESARFRLNFMREARRPVSTGIPADAEGPMTIGQSGEGRGAGERSRGGETSHGMQRVEVIDRCGSGWNRRGSVSRGADRELQFYESALGRKPKKEND